MQVPPRKKKSPESSKCNGANDDSSDDFITPTKHKAPKLTEAQTRMHENMKLFMDTLETEGIDKEIQQIDK